MEIDKTETNNFQQCRLFANVSIDSWQQKCQMVINKTETNNFRQCQSFVNVSIDSWQHTCQMEINKNEMNNFRQCRSFIDKMIVELFPTSAGALPFKLMYPEEARTRNIFNDDYQLIVDLFLNPNREGARADVASATICN
jgi:hypothetical protein